MILEGKNDGLPGRGRSEAMLLVVTVLWGLTFPLVKGALADTGPFDFLALRFPVGLVVLWPLLGFRRPAGSAWTAGLLLGLLLAASYAGQTAGLRYTTSTRSAFITGLSVLLIPPVYFLRTRVRLGGRPAVGAMAAVAGLLLLTEPGRSGVNRGDVLTLAAALGYALYIVELEMRSRRHSYRDLLVVQFLVLSAVFLPAALLEREPLRGSATLVVAVALTGAILGFTLYLQNRFQRGTSAPRAGVIFSAEPAFAAAFSFLILGETLSEAQWVGAGLMLAGMVLAVLAPRRRAAPVDPRESGG